MKYFQRISVEHFVRLIVEDDRETSRIVESWNMEKEEIVSFIVNQLKEIGIFHVEPMGHAQIIYNNIHFQLRNSPEIKAGLRKIQEEIEKNKAKHSRHSK